MIITQLACINSFPSWIVHFFRARTCHSTFTHNCAVLIHIYLKQLKFHTQMWSITVQMSILWCTEITKRERKKTASAAAATEFTICVHNRNNAWLECLSHSHSTDAQKGLPAKIMPINNQTGVNTMACVCVCVCNIKAMLQLFHIQ